MSGLKMISVPVDMRELRRLAALRQTSNDEGRALHHLLSETFGKSLLQPFRLMVAPQAREGTLYAYTDVPETTLQDHSALAAPELLGVFKAQHLSCRDMPQRWREGRRVAFDLRVRPVRRLLKPLEAWSREDNRLALSGKTPHGPIRKGREVDAFLVARMRRYPDGMPAGHEGGGDALSREAVYVDWLVERFEGAAVLDKDRTHMTKFIRSMTGRRSTAGAEALSGGPDATFHGELTIIDSDGFSKLLGSGVGRHRAYGYGMLLLRPASGG